MPPVSVFIIFMLLNLLSFHVIARYLARRRPAPPAAASRGGARRAAAPVVPVTMPTAARAPEPSARAFPVLGLLPGRVTALALESLLKRMAGVTAAYVSPITALAYINYVPAQVTEEQLVGAIVGGGYGVGTVAQRFDWRHASAADGLPVAAHPAAAHRALMRPRRRTSRINSIR